MKQGRFYLKEKFLVFALVAASVMAWMAVMAYGYYLPPTAEETVSAPELVAVPLESSPEEAAPPGPVVDADLESALAAWAQTNPGRYGVVVREIGPEQRVATYQAEETFIATSTYKLFLVYAVLRQIEVGELAPDAVTSNGMSVRECIDSLLIYSWDECGWPLGSLLGWGWISDFLHEQGFSDTHLNNYDSEGSFTGDKYSTPADQAEFAWRLEQGKLFGEPEHRELMLSRLEEQIWQERIPAGLPEGVRVANKPGWLYDYENDTAIVYGERSNYVLVVMSEGSSVEHLAELSTLVYEHLHATE